MAETPFDLSRRELLAALATIGAGGAAVSAGTYTAFTDKETTSGDSLRTGVLNLEFGTTTIEFTTSDIAPGDKGAQEVSLKNAGNVAGDLTITIDSITHSEGNTPDAETDGVVPEQAIELKMFLDSDGDGDFTDSSSDQGLKPDGTVASSGLSFNDANEYPVDDAYKLGKLGSSRDFVVKWFFEDDGSQVDGAMDDKLTISFKFTLTQSSV